MEKRRILIVDNNDELRVLLEQALGRLGHEVVVTGERAKALRRDDLDSFDLIISDLSEAEVNGEPISELHRKHLVTLLGEHYKSPGLIKAFKMGAANYPRSPYNRDELREIVEQTLFQKLRHVDDDNHYSHVHEKIEFELPSDLSLMNGVLEYLQERVAKLGLIHPDRSNLFVALDEAFVNAVKHGNKNDPTKLLKITAELSPAEAAFTVEDEGQGMPERDLPRIFDRFYSRDRKKTEAGTGLGLPYCKLVAEAHGGTIKATNGKQRGFTVSVLLPMREWKTEGVYAV